jgi:hypothetical protein
MGYGLMDMDSAREMGSFRSLRAALLAVLDVVGDYGANSPEALNLALASTHGDPRTASNAHGEELVKRAPELRAGHRRAGAVTRRRKRTAA